MKKKRGFTLIELLGVIVILAIIMIIAIPKILDVIEKADRQAYEDSVNLMVKTAKLKYQSGSLTGDKVSLPYTVTYQGKNQVITTDDGESTVIDEKDPLYLNFKGDKPFSGTIRLNENGKVEVIELVSNNEKWCAKKEATGSVVVKSVKENNCTVSSGSDDEEIIIEDPEPCKPEEIYDTDNTTILGYAIYSESDLYKLSEEVNSADSKLSGKYDGKEIRLMNNLDMSTPDSTCGLSSFEPIGNSTKKFKGIFNGQDKTISNLTIDKPENEYVGLFGYVSDGGVNSLKIDNFNIKGKNYVGAIGYAYTGTIKDLSIENVKITGENYVAAIGYNGYATIQELYLDEFNISATSTSGNAGSIISYNQSGYLKESLVKKGKINSNYSAKIFSSGQNLIAENVDVNAPEIEMTPNETSKVYYSNNCTKNGTKIANGFDPSSINDINFYETVGLDTWIGGDNDSSKYYFDYDKNKVVLKYSEKDKIPTLDTINEYFEKDGDYYIIKDEKDWKNASVFIDKKFKLGNSLDFTSKKFYMFGSLFNKFSGELNGNDKSLNNITISATAGEYQGEESYYPRGTNAGIFGYVYGATISSLRINNFDIKGYDNIGVIGFYKLGNVKDIIVDSIVMSANNRVGFIGYNRGGTANEIFISDFDVTSTGSYSYAGPLVGYRSSGDITKVLIKNGKVKSNYIGNVFSGYGSCNSACIAENVAVTTENKDAEEYNEVGKVYFSKKCSINNENFNNGFKVTSINDLNFYESVGLDTWIGGDNTKSGYYLDYNSNGNVIMKSVKDNPLPTNENISNFLSKEGEYYVIENTADWKNASAVLNNKFILKNNLDFANNKYYMFGSLFNKFGGEIDGNDKSLNNITISTTAGEYQGEESYYPRGTNAGIFGYIENGKVSSLRLNNINIDGYDNVGIVGYYRYGEINGLIAENITISGHRRVGTIGYNYGMYSTGYLRDFALNNFNYSGSDYVGGLEGYHGTGKIYNALIKNGTIRSDESADIFNGNSTYNGDAWIAENVSVTAETISHQTSTEPYWHYASNCKENNTYVTDGFSEIGDLTFYNSILGKTSYSEYKFANVSGKGVWLIKK